MGLWAEINAIKAVDQYRLLKMEFKKCIYYIMTHIGIGIEYP